MAKTKAFTRDLLSSLSLKIVETFPTNIYETVQEEAVRLNIADSKNLSDAVSGVVYLWRNSEGASPQDLTSDLLEMDVISQEQATLLEDLLGTLAPSFRTADAVAAYKDLGLPALDDMTGTVDLRFRFHNSVDAFENYDEPRIEAVHAAIVVSLILNDAKDVRNVVTFQMDESDLAMMERCTKLLRRELQLVKGKQKLVQEGMP